MLLSHAANIQPFHSTICPRKGPQFKYQIGEKRLQDRKGRALEHDDIEHYQRTVSALAETRTLMAQIDLLIANHGGSPLD
jgi:hypothetical protein